ncbi:putative mitochondrial import inner membrane translocase subunit TIM22 [Helianthus anomalus]
MKGEAELAVGNHRKHVLETACKRFKNWVRLPPLYDVTGEAVLATLGLTTSFCYSLFGQVLINHVCITNSIPLPSPKSQVVVYVVLVQFLSLFGGYKPLAESFIARGISERTRNFAIMAACNEIIPSFMKNARGEKDVQTSLVAGFGYGVMISLVTGMRGPTSIMSVGVACALVNVGRFKVIMFF